MNADECIDAKILRWRDERLRNFTDNDYAGYFERSQKRVREHAENKDGRTTRLYRPDGSKGDYELNTNEWLRRKELREIAKTLNTGTVKDVDVMVSQWKRLYNIFYLMAENILICTNNKVSSQYWAKKRNNASDDTPCH